MDTYVEFNNKQIRACQSHNPRLRRRIPRHLRIPELRALNVNDRILRVRLKRISIIETIRKILRLETAVRGDCVESNNTIVLVWEEAARVIRINDRGARVDIGRAIERP